MPILQRKRRLFIRKTELFCLRPELDHIGGGYTRAYGVDRRVQYLTAILVSIHHRLRSTTNSKRTVIAGPVAVVTMQDIKVSRITGPKGTIAKDMGVWTAALAGDGIDTFDLFGPHIIEQLTHESNALILAHSRLHKAIKLIVGCIHHHTGRRQQGNLVRRLDEPGLLHQ